MNTAAIIALILTVVFAVDFNIMTAVSQQGSRYRNPLAKMFKKIGLGNLAMRLDMVPCFPNLRAWSLAAFSVSFIAALAFSALAQNAPVLVATIAVATVAYAAAFFTLNTQVSK